MNKLKSLWRRGVGVALCAVACLAGSVASATDFVNESGVVDASVLTTPVKAGVVLAINAAILIAVILLVAVIAVRVIKRFSK